MQLFHILYFRRLVLLSALFLTVSQISIAQEWERLPADEEKITFQAADLKNARHSVWTKRDPAHKFATRQVSQWVANGFYKSILYLTELAGMYYTEKWSLSKITTFGAFKGKTVNFGAKGVTKGDLGRIEYQVFKSQDRGCVVLRSYWGQQTGAFGVSEGTSSLIGYYCAEMGTSLTVTQAEQIIKMIGIKKGR